MIIVNVENGCHIKIGMEISMQETPTKIKNGQFTKEQVKEHNSHVLIRSKNTNQQNIVSQFEPIHQQGESCIGN